MMLRAVIKTTCCKSSKLVNVCFVIAASFYVQTDLLSSSVTPASSCRCSSSSSGRDPRSDSDRPPYGQCLQHRIGWPGMSISNTLAAVSFIGLQTEAAAAPRSRMPMTLDGQLTIEKTPSYFVTKSVPHRVYSMSPNVKLIVVVRDPVTRALSDYTQARLKRPDLPSFEAMAFINVSVDPTSDDVSVNSSWGAIRIGLYERYLSRWLQLFSLDRFHFVNGERLVVDPAGELGRLQDFLGVKRLVTDKHFYYNATKGFPCLKKSEKGGAPRCLGQSKGRSHPVIGTVALQRLRHFYRPHNRRFYELTGVDFSWR